MSRKKYHIKIRLARIFSKYLKGKPSSDEEDFVDKFYDSMDQYGPDHYMRSDKDKEDVKNHIDQYISAHKTGKRNKVFPHIRTVAAIAVFALSALFGLFIWSRQGTSKAENLELVRSGNPIPAFSIVKDGETFDLHNMVPEGTVLDTINDEKVLVIQALAKSQSDFHTIKNTSKEVLSVLLSDGSQVWLDAGAELTFADDFNLSLRQVNIKGEAYFDVAKSVQQDKRIPFIVQTSLQKIEVLGTQFNVNAREDSEQSITLIEGKVKLTHQKYASDIIMQPDQMATLSDRHAKILVTKSDQLDKVLAWRKGLFYFQEENLKEVMEELGSWYGKEIVVDKNIQHIRYSGILSRYPDLGSVLSLLALTEDIQFTREGEKIYIKGNGNH